MERIRIRSTYRETEKVLGVTVINSQNTQRDCGVLCRGSMYVCVHTHTHTHTYDGIAFIYHFSYTLFTDNTFNLFIYFIIFSIHFYPIVLPITT